MTAPFQREHPHAKLYWRVKENGKWKWIAAQVRYKGGYSIMVDYLLEEEE